MIVGEGEVHHRPNFHLIPHGNRALLDGMKAEDGGLGWIENGSGENGSVDATIRDGETELERKFSIPNSVVRALIHLPEQKLLEIEREACANVCLDLTAWHSKLAIAAFESAADAIKARGNNDV